MKKSSPSEHRLEEVREHRSPSAHRGAVAFSLLEVVSIVSIMSVMLVLVAPAISSITGANGTTRAVGEISGAVEHARQVAMQTGTWVWLGMANTEDPMVGESQITLVTVASKDGSSDMSANNLVQLTAATRVDLVRLNNSDGDGFILGSAPGDFSFGWEVPVGDGRERVDFSTFVLGFSPRGEAVVESSSVEDWVRVVMESPGNPKDRLSVLVSGPSGQVIVSR